MRFLTLQLLAYGAFSEHCLEFPPNGPALHVILGNNEAGKSTALRAVCALLFGFPHQSKDGFLHGNANLRVGARVLRGDGSTLEFVRRKRVNGSLCTFQDVPLGGDCLVPLLGGIAESDFTQRFGLGAQSLRDGAKDLLDGGGEITQSLFEAGTGLRGLSRLRVQLQKEAASLFASRGGSKYEINDALTALSNAQKEVRSQSFSAGAWQKLEKEQEVCEAERSEIRKEREERQRELSRLDRYERALPTAALLRQRRAEWEPLKDRPRLPPSATSERIGLQQRLDAQTRARTRVEAELRTVVDELKSLGDPSPIVGQRDRIMSAFARVAHNEKARADRPNRVAELERLELKAQEALRGMYPSLSLTDIETVRLTIDQMQRIDRLATSRTERGATLRNAEKSLHNAEAAYVRALTDRDTLSAPPDLSTLQKLVQEIRSQGPLETNLASARSRLESDEQQATLDAIALAGEGVSLESLEAACVPLPESCDRFDEEAREQRERQQRVGAELDRVGAQIERLEADIATQLRHGNVPSKGELSAARQHREQGWGLIRRAWLKKEDVAAAADVYDPGRALPEAFAHSVNAADTLADQLFLEAERVTKLADLQVELQTLVNEREELKTESLALEEQRLKVQREWEALWEPAKLKPNSPREMRAWLGRVARLREAGATLRLKRRECEDQAEVIQTLKTRLSAALSSLSSPPSTSGNTLAELLAVAEHASDENRNSQQAWLSKNEAVEHARTTQEHAAREIATAHTELEAWQKEWVSAVACLNKDPAPEPPEAQAIVCRLRECFETMEQRKVAATRVQEIDAELQTFQEQVRSIAMELAPESLDQTPEILIQRLQSDLESARDRAISRTALEARQAKLQEEVKRLEAESEELKTLLGALRQAAGAADDAELEAAESASVRLITLEEKIAELEEALLRESAGGTIAEFEAELFEIDPDGLPIRREALLHEIDALQSKGEELDQRLGGMRSERQRVTGGDEAATCAEEAQLALSRLESGVERYVRVRLAAETLGYVMTQYRERNENPLLKRASQHFQHLTCGSIQRLSVAYDDKDNQFLQGIRKDGTSLRVPAMSDGTRDQLYLSLRVAGLEQHLDTLNPGGEPLPFIVDDLFVNFDDLRAAEGLKILAELSRRTQVLFFTHHSRLVELASGLPSDHVAFHAL